MPTPSGFFARLDEPSSKAEIVVQTWEIFSALIFVSAVVPGGFATVWTELLFLVSMAVSALVSRRLLSKGARGYAWAAGIRAVSWPLAVAPLVNVDGPQVLVAALAFGLMAGGMRRAVYRRFCDPPVEKLSQRALAASLRSRLSESATLVGIVGGHVMILFSVAFLRTKRQVIFDAWLEMVPALALFGTVAFTLAVRPVTSSLVASLEAGPNGEKALLERGLRQAIAAPRVLAILNFVVWFSFTAMGILTVRPGPAPWREGDAVMQLGFGMLFSWGVAFYQRLLHRGIVAPAIAALRHWTGQGADEYAAEPTPLEKRMLREFGLPLVFMAALSLLSSIGLYRTLGADLGVREDFNAVTALVASFGLLMLAVGGVVAHAARELSRPMTTLANAADRVARGKLDASLPRVGGPIEVVGLGESIERMREALARTIEELEHERAGLEEKVLSRTSELREALDELKRAQAALVHGERLASIGELVSGVAHEINNPLNAIAGAAAPLEQVVSDVRELIDAYRLAEPDLPPERRKTIDALRERLDVDASLDDLVGISSVVRRAIDRSVRIVQNLRNFSRTSTEPLPTDLHAGIEETLMLLAPRLRQGGIRIERRFGELPSAVCRANEINQVFMNLLVNAVQSLETAPRRAVADEADGEPAIDLESWMEGEFACVAVADNGPGVPDALAGRVFDPFFTTKPKGQGTGLGLAISTEIARRHGGTLTLDRSRIRGARFVCRIPVGRRSEAKMPATVPGSA